MIDYIDKLLADERRCKAIINTMNNMMERSDIRILKLAFDQVYRDIKSTRKVFVLHREYTYPINTDFLGER